MEILIDILLLILLSYFNLSRFKIEKKDINLTEVIIQHWVGGNVMFKHLYFKGLQHGQQKYYHENGKLNGQTFYKNGQANGIHVEFDWYGKRKFIQKWTNGQRHSPLIEFKY